MSKIMDKIKSIIADIKIIISKIHMPKMIFMPSHKGWFKGLGLHHASITVGWIMLGWIFGIGWFGGACAIGWYGQREYGNGPYPPRTFEVMDFVSPVLTSLIYFALVYHSILTF